MSWNTERASDFEAMLAEFGSTLTFNGTEIPCLSPPKERIDEMKRTNYVAARHAQFSVKRTDFTARGLGLRKQFTSVGSTFEIFALLDDDAEPFVDFRAELKQ